MKSRRVLNKSRRVSNNIFKSSTAVSFLAPSEFHNELYVGTFNTVNGNFLVGAIIKIQKIFFFSQCST